MNWLEIVAKYGEWVRTYNGEKPNLCGADLREADLREADLRGANLRGADLPAPTMLLMADWRELSDETTLALMRLDCAACPKGKVRFDKWAASGVCPYNDIKTQRVAVFAEKKELWKYGRPPSIWKCLCMVLDECCPRWRGKGDQL